MTFKTGDLVKLKSGGASMTVRCILGDGQYPTLEEPYLLGGYNKGDVLCEWQLRNKAEAAAYHPEQLEYA